jgi:hypothetical protein
MIGLCIIHLKKEERIKLYIQIKYIIIIIKNMKIFVQIASYRDPELVNTIVDMLDKAKRPKNLVLAIARQYAEEDGFDNLDKWRKDKRLWISLIMNPRGLVGQEI